MIKKNFDLDSIIEAHRKVPPDYYDRSIRRNLLQRYWHQRRFSEVRKFLEKKEGNIWKILDVGCHDGRFTSEIRKIFPRAKIYGIDIYSNAVDYARKKYPSIRFTTAQAEEIPHKKDSFDLITCFEVLEHVISPSRVIDEVRKKLKRKGIFLLIVPSENFLFKLIWFFWTRMGPGRVWRDTHLHQIRDKKLQRILSQKGFEEIVKKPFLLGMLLLVSAKRK